MAELSAGDLLIAEGEYNEGLARLDSGMGFLDAAEVLICRSYYDAQAALALSRLGRRNEADVRIQNACDMAKERQQGMHQAEMWRLRGLIESECNKPDAAEGSIRRALNISRAQSAKGWELRAATSLADLWQRRVQIMEARDLLAPIYVWFAEGFDTADLKGAKALLKVLQ